MEQPAAAAPAPILDLTGAAGASPAAATASSGAELFDEQFLRERRALENLIKDAKGRKLAAEHLSHSVKYFFKDLWRMIKVLFVLLTLVVTARRPRPVGLADHVCVV